MPEPPTFKIRPLRDPLILVIDDSVESCQARELIEAAGINPVINGVRPDPWDQKPFVLWRGGPYEGLEGIKGLLRLMALESKEEPVDRRIFAD